MDIKRAQIIISVLLLLAVAAAVGFAACGETAPSAAGALTPEPTEEQGVQTIVTEPPEFSPTPAPEPTDAPAPSPTATPEPAPEPPVYTGPDLEAQPPVSDEYFSDTAFFGNSLVGGLQLYGGLNYGDFFGVTSAAVYNVGLKKNSRLRDGTPATMVDALCETQYGKIYILLGINEISFEPELFIQQYTEILNTIAEREPDAEFYIMSLSPVTEAKSNDPTPFTEERVLAYNEALYALAAERGCWYVDLVDALAGEDGYLPAEISTDGIHLTRETYPIWAEYLRTHYVAGRDVPLRYTPEEAAFIPEEAPAAEPEPAPEAPPETPVPPPATPPPATPAPTPAWPAGAQIVIRPSSPNAPSPEQPSEPETEQPSTQEPETKQAPETDTPGVIRPSAPDTPGVIRPKPPNV